jgi:hypothetical protein
MDDEPITFLGRPLGPSFHARVVTVPPGAVHPFVESEWRDALVVVEHGEVELEGAAGGRRRFGAGSLLWFSGLGLRALHNRGAHDLVLVAVRRAVSSGPSSPG